MQEERPFPEPKWGSCLTLGNEETPVLTSKRFYWERAPRVESRRVREPRRTALPHGLQSRVLW